MDNPICMKQVILIDSANEYGAIIKVDTDNGEYTFTPISHAFVEGGQRDKFSGIRQKGTITFPNGETEEGSMFWLVNNTTAWIKGDIEKVCDWAIPDHLSFEWGNILNDKSPSGHTQFCAYCDCSTLDELASIINDDDEYPNIIVENLCELNEWVIEHECDRDICVDDEANEALTIDDDGLAVVVELAK